MIIKNFGDDFICEYIAFLDHFADIHVMDRVIVRPEFEITPYRGKVSRFKRRTEGIHIAYVGTVHRAQQQVGGVEALASVERRQSSVLSFKAADKCLIGRSIDIFVPLGCIAYAQRRSAHRLQDTLIETERRPYKGYINAAARILFQE